MTGGILSWAPVALLGLLLIAAAVSDLRSRIISNRLNLAIALLAPAFWLTSGLSLWPDIPLQIASALAVFAVFVGMFALRMIGGGDVKMLGALALWFPWQTMLWLLILMAIFGGIVTVVTVIHHRIGRRIGRAEVPYGVAISLAGLWVISERYIYQMT